MGAHYIQKIESKAAYALVDRGLVMVYSPSNFFLKGRAT